MSRRARLIHRLRSHAIQIITTAIIANPMAIISGKLFDPPVTGSKGISCPIVSAPGRAVVRPGRPGVVQPGGLGDVDSAVEVGGKMRGP